jgi:iron complex outermembrane receptor protein
VLLDQKTGMLDFKNIMQPKMGMILTPIQDYSIFANWGRTFQLPAPPESFGQTAGGAFLPRNFHESQNDGWEAGVTASPIKPVNVRLSYWEMNATNEVVGDVNGGRINGGETERKGVDLSFNAIVHPWVTIWGSYSIVDAKYVKPAPGLENRKGKELELVPEFTAKAGVDFEHPKGFRANLWMDIVDDYYPLVADFALRTKEHGGYEVAHLSLGYDVGPGITTGLDVRNIFDKDYYSWVWDYDVGYEPGQPRSVYGWVKFEY